MKIAARLTPGTLYIERAGAAVLTDRSIPIPIPEGLRYASEGALTELLEQVIAAVNQVLEPE
jgi:hypothetical protein